MNWRKWILPGLAVASVATAIATFLARGDVERDLAARVAAALVASGQDWAVVSAAARDIVISGTGPAPESGAAAIRAASAVPGVRTVTDGTTLLPLAAPYTWSVRRAGQQVTLTGSVPSAAARAATLSTARQLLPQAEIAERMSLARGAPASFLAGAAFALGRVASLSEGTVTLTDATLSVSGVAADATAYAAFQSAFARDVPAGLEIGAVDVLPVRASRYVWSAHVDRGTITVAGNVPNQAVREALAAAIKAATPAVVLVDALTVASGEPPGFAAAATFAAGTVQRLQRGGITLDGLALDIAGEAKSVADYEALFATLANPPSGMRVASAEVVPASVPVYAWQAEVADGKVTLTGYAPSREWRADLAAFARTAIGGAVVDDRVRVARGEPRMDWVGAVKFALGQASLLSRGTAAISANAYSVSGEARDSKAYATLLEQTAKTLPAGLVLKATSVTPPRASPYRFTTERRDGQFMLDGHVARDDERQSILAAARRMAHGTDVIENLSYASGAPPGFTAAATASVRALARLAGGRAEIADRSVSLTGTAYHEAAASDIAAALRDALPSGFTLAKLDIVAAAPGQPLGGTECREQLQVLLKAGRIEFEGNGAAVTADSLGTLDRAAGIILRCPEATVEVAVHSDNEGSAATLRERTQSRAELILDYLVGAGVQRERLAAVGYGASHPIADNRTATGRAANRRVELTLAVPNSG
jgi:outer membrane protein OmpA-like peptidoglycan-associated protein/osmotically-inducible protein OsmY